MNDDIDITGCDLRVLISTAYELSSPQGMGFLHSKAGPLDDATIDAIIARGKDDGYGPVDMDYVHGRSIKLRTSERNGKWYMPRRWYDHSDAQLQALLKAINREPGRDAKCLDEVSSESLGN